MKKSAILSKDRKYRYVLSRSWDDSKQTVMIIGLNPSTADETNDDPTITRCINFAKYWGYGGVHILNLFAFRATQPDDMFDEHEPIGVDNNKYLQNYAEKCDKVICAWGNHGKFNDRSREIKSKLNNLYYLKLN